jgi:hypothetical protein
VCEICPGRHGESVGLGGVVELGEERAAAHADPAGCRVHVHRVESAEIEAQRTVPQRAPRDRVGTGTHGEGEPVLGGGANGGGHVVGVGRRSHRCRSAIDRAVPAEAAIVVVRMPGLHDPAHEAVGTEGRGER